MLQLDQLVFVEQTVHAVRNYEPDEPSNSHVDVDFAAEPGEDDRWFSSLAIRLNEEKSENFPYQFSIQAFCMVTCQDEVQNKDLRVRQTALQMLAGACRERLAEMTARGPWDVFLLSALPMSIAEQENSEDKQERGTASVTGTRKDSKKR